MQCVVQNFKFLHLTPFRCRVSLAVKAWEEFFLLCFHPLCGDLPLAIAPWTLWTGALCLSLATLDFFTDTLHQKSHLLKWTTAVQLLTKESMYNPSVRLMAYLFLFASFSKCTFLYSLKTVFHRLSQLRYFAIRMRVVVLDTGDKYDIRLKDCADHCSTPFDKLHNQEGWHFGQQGASYVQVCCWTYSVLG